MNSKEHSTEDLEKVPLLTSKAIVTQVSKVVHPQGQAAAVLWWTEMKHSGRHGWNNTEGFKNQSQFCRGVWLSWGWPQHTEKFLFVFIREQNNSLEKDAWSNSPEVEI